MLNDHPVVLFHSDCSDGFTAAWIANNAMKGRDPFFFGVQYGQEPPKEAFSGHALYILDFSYPTETMRKLIDRASVLVCLDHHKTAKDALEPLRKEFAEESRIQISFDMGKCGARMTWEHFNAKKPNDPPLLVQYVEARDLWKWNLPGSREISAWLASFPKTFDAWDNANRLLDSNRLAIADQGAAILQYQQRVVENHVKNAIEVTIGGYKVRACNCTTLISEVCEQLGVEAPFGATYFVNKDGKKVWSLRSRPPHGIDVSKVALSMGGGGHPGAAGFTEK